MSIKPLLNNGMVQRSQDISPIKQNQDIRPQVEQMNIQKQHEKDVDRTSKQIVKKENAADFKDNRHDAREKTKGIFFDIRKKNTNGKESEDDDGVVVAKGNQHFDMRI